MGKRARRKTRPQAVSAPPTRQSREQPPAEQAPAERAPTELSSPRVSRSEAKNAAVREALEPLEEGERPRAVTVAALVALALALTEIVVYLAGQKINGKRPAIPGIAAFSIVMLVAAWGMWRVRYWAVLGMQALLGLTILAFSLNALKASNVGTVLLCLAVMGPAGTLFWFLVRAMARIQMPERRPR